MTYRAIRFYAKTMADVILDARASTQDLSDVKEEFVEVDAKSEDSDSEQNADK